ncbi:precorrin-2 dehydrogenase/sirohydrochlorin ferrochelatase family protein [Deinococcus psychrotolerans]|nr:bifunctional precorrin-2 dehydrogenase/sirohydrochlorin ferrochelatase [Deinococcus psychrotolerans]
MNLAAMLDLEGETALLVGGGTVALRRAATLLTAGLTVRVVAPELLPQLAALNIEIIQRPFEPGDLTGVRLVVACTDNADVNDEVTRLAKAAGLLINHVGRAEAGNLRFPAVLERGGVSVSISTGAELPMLAQALREKVALCLPAELPIPTWTSQRDAALLLNGEAKQVAIRDLRAQIRTAVGL